MLETALPVSSWPSSCEICEDIGESLSAAVAKLSREHYALRLHIHLTGLWSNGSASDSRSEGWEFECLWPHLAGLVSLSELDIVYSLETARAKQLS